MRSRHPEPRSKIRASGQCKLSLEWLTTNQSLFFSMSVACC